MSEKSCRKDKLQDSEIVEYVRRFGPVTTAQVAKRFAFSTRGSLNAKLKKMAALIREQRGQINIWRAA